MQKDFTDFILLDNIYQKALSSDDIGVFILFSGDGHFSSVTSFLKNFYHKEVVVYGINGSFSRQLQETATTCFTLPREDELFGSYYQHIFEYLKNSARPTLDGAIDEVSKKSRNASKQMIARALKALEDEDVISERTINIKSAAGRQKKQSCLFVDWDRAAKHAYFAEKETV